MASSVDAERSPCPDWSRPGERPPTRRPPPNVSRRCPSRIRRRWLLRPPRVARRCPSRIRRRSLLRPPDVCRGCRAMLHGQPSPLRPRRTPRVCRGCPSRPLRRHRPPCPSRPTSLRRRPRCPVSPRYWPMCWVPTRSRSTPTSSTTSVPTRMVMAQFCARVRKRDDLPSVSMKDVYQHPTISSLATALAGCPPPTARVAPPCAPALRRGARRGAGRRPGRRAGVGRQPLLRRPRRRLDGHGPVLRPGPQAGRPAVGVDEGHLPAPHDRGLAAALADGRRRTLTPRRLPRRSGPIAPSRRVPTPAGRRRRDAGEHPVGTPLRPVRGAAAPVLPRILLPRRARRRRRASCGSPAATGMVDIYLRSVAVRRAPPSSCLCTLPILAKWVLIGRWKPQQIRVWSLAYLRFWIVKTLVRSNPLVLLFVGLAALRRSTCGRWARRSGGASRSSPGTCPCAPTCSPSATARSSARTRSSPATGPTHGVIQTGPVTLGKDVFVGEKTVLDIDTSMGDGAQLGHSSSLHAGQAVPGGERWHGSPGAARPTWTTGRSRRPPAARCAGSATPLVQLLNAAGAVPAAGVRRPASCCSPRSRGSAGCWTRRPLVVTSWTLLPRRPGRLARAVLRRRCWSACVFVVTVPRLLNLAIKPDKVYRLYGFHYSVHRAIAPHDQPQVLHLPVRRQLLHRPLPALARVRPAPTSSRPGRTSARR